MTGDEIKKMADGYPPISIGMDHEEVVVWLAKHSIQLHEQVRALAAEVSECRRFVVEELGPESGIQFAALSTERSDEVLRETRAQAVEGFSKHLRSHMQDGSPLGLLAMGADEFAEKIREGEQP